MHYKTEVLKYRHAAGIVLNSLKYTAVLKINKRSGKLQARGAQRVPGS